MAKKSKRVLSVLLTLVMIVGLLPTSVFAEDATSGTVEWQKDSWTFSGDGKVAHKKTIEKTGENEFEITLSVKTMEEIKEQAVSEDAAVVLVMDVSNSMKETVDGKEPDDASEQRIYKAKEAAKNFIDSFAADDAQRKVALVEFGSSAYTVQGWTDIDSAKSAVDNVGINFEYPNCTIQGPHTHDVNTIEWGGLLGIRWRCSVKGCDLYRETTPIYPWFNWYWILDREYNGHTHEQTFNGPHGETLTDGGGTNIEGGLQLADNLLGSSDISNIKNRYVVLITDGVPTYHVYQGRDNSSLTFIEGQSGGGNYAAPSDYQNVPNVANSIKSQATLYTVSYASDKVKDKVDGKTIDAWLASFANKNVAAGADIDLGLGQISQIIQNQAKAWILTDPIPASNYITFSFDDNEGIPDLATNPGTVFGYDSTKGELVWNLKADPPKRTEQENGVTWHIYEETYTIRLNTAGKGFVEDKPYETNGTTTLSYMVTENGQLNPELQYTKLVVPTVSGKIPEYEYHVEYYLQGNAKKGEYKDYELKKSDTPILADLHSTPTILVDGKIPQHIQDKYKGELYHCAGANPASVTITNDPTSNVIKVYYDHDTVDVTVNHYYKTITIAEDGTSDKETAKYDGPHTETYEDRNVGDEFTAVKNEDPDGNHYTFEQDKSDPLTIDKLGYENDPIDLYYVRTVDQRNAANILEQYVLVDKTWELNDQGKYELVEKSSDPHEVYDSKDVPNADWREFDEYTAVVEKPAVINDGYTFDHAEATNGIVADTQAKTILDAGDNTLTLYYEKQLPDTRVPATVTIRHFYTMDRTYIDENGEVKHEKYTDQLDEKATVTVTEDIYVGESFTAGAEFLKTEYDGFQFAPNETNDYTLETLSGNSNENVINIYYTYNGSQTPDEAAITVVHEYYDATRIYNEETDEIEIDYALNDELTEEISYPNAAHPLYNVLYVGQKFEAPLNPVAGYEFNEAKSDERVVNALAATNAPITLCYYETDPDEGRDEASIAVRHTYKTNWTVANPSGLGTTVSPDTDAQSIVRDENLDNYSGHQGDPFTPTPNTSYKDKDDYVLTSGNAGEVTLKATGSNGTIELVYERSDSDLTPATYTVTHHYNLRTMSLVNGTAQWSNWQEVGSSDSFTINGGQQLPAELYIGNTFEVDKAETFAYDLNGDGVAENLTFTMGADPGLTVKVDEATGHLDIYYYYSDELPKAPVRVRHEYTEHKFLYSPSGVEIEDTKVTYNPSSSNWIITWYYVGETALVEPLPLDYTYDGTSNGTLNADGKVELTVASGNNDVILSYSKETDRRDSASVTVTHIYKTRDYDGSTTEVSRNSNTVPYFAGMPFTVSYNTMGGIYPKNGISVTASGEYTETVMQDAVTLANVVSGDSNSITITYIRDVDTRETTKVQVTYNYYARDTYTDDDTMSDADYIAQEGMQPEYTVVEILESKAQGVWVGHEYTAADKPEYTVGEGDEAVTLTYGFVNSTPEGRKIASLAAMEEGTTAVPEANKIVANYLRKYSTDPGDVAYTVVHEYYSNGNFVGHIVDETGIGKVGSTIRAEDITKITSFEGRTYRYRDADPESMVLVGASDPEIMALAADGEENVMTLRYTRTSGGGGGGSTDPDPDPEPPTDIEDPDVPTTELPEEPTDPAEPVEEPTEIEEPDVPMAEAPETGDSNFAYLHLLSLASAMGLAALFISDKRSKKHRDET